MTGKSSSVVLTANDLPPGFLGRKGAERAPKNFSVSAIDANDALSVVDPDELIWFSYRRLVFGAKFLILSPDHQAPFGPFFRAVSKFAIAVLKNYPSDAVESARSYALRECISIRSALDSLIETRYGSKLALTLPRMKATSNDDGPRQFLRVANGLARRTKRRRDLAAVAHVKVDVSPVEGGAEPAPDIRERASLDPAPHPLESVPTYGIELGLAHETQELGTGVPTPAVPKLPRPEEENPGELSRRTGFSVVHVTELKPWSNGFPWLVEGIWQSGGDGIIGGPPKTLKTYFVIDMSVSVASGSACLGRFSVPNAGPVLVYLGEDAEEAIIERVRGIALAKQVSLDKIPLHFVRTPSIRLDAGPDLKLLRQAVRQYRPRLLVLDPLIRLHRGDENSAALVSRVLGDLRILSREFEVAIAVVHHIRKKRSGTQEGQNLRGSGDLHGWGDSNVYLVRDRRGRVRFSCEHRAASAQPAVIIEYRANPAPHIVVTGEADDADDESSDGGERDIGQEILNVLTETGQPMTRDALRDKLGCRAEKVSAALTELAESDRIARPSRRGWILTNDASARKDARADPVEPNDA